MKVAILGAGFGGLAVGWYLKHYTLGSARIDFFDPNPIGGGASRIALGLIHPYMGKYAYRNFAATRCLRELHRLLTESAAMVGGPLVISRGILRPAIELEQVQEFQKRAKTFPDLEWLEPEAAFKYIPSLVLPKGGGALYFKEGIAINVDKYLEGLWLSIARHAAQYRKISILQKGQLAPYDKVVIALGANALDFEILKGLPMSRVKGQVIQLEWPKEIPPLTTSIAGEGQIVMAPDFQSCFVGSTYEHQFSDIKATPEKAREEILHKISPFFPHLSSAKLLACRARVRGSSQSRLPLLGKVNDKVWFLTGLGSKGLFYHAWAARQFAHALIMNDTSYIQEELLCTLPKNASPPQKSGKKT